MKSLFLIFLLLIASCGRQQTQFASSPQLTPTPPTDASSARPVVAAESHVTVDKYDDPDAYRIVMAFKAFQRGEISEQKMVNILFTSPSFDHATRVVAREYSRGVRMGETTDEQKHKFGQLAAMVHQSIYVRDTEQRRNNLISVAIAAILGGVIDGAANMVVFRFFRAPSLIRTVLTRGIIPVFIATGIIGGMITGLARYIGTGTYQYWEAERNKFFSAEMLNQAARKNNPQSESHLD